MSTKFISFARRRLQIFLLHEVVMSGDDNINLVKGTLFIKGTVSEALSQIVVKRGNGQRRYVTANSSACAGAALSSNDAALLTMKMCQVEGK